MTNKTELVISVTYEQESNGQYWAHGEVRIDGKPLGSLNRFLLDVREGHSLPELKAVVAKRVTNRELRKNSEIRRQVQETTDLLAKLPGIDLSSPLK